MRIGVVGAGVIGRLRAQSITRNAGTTLAAVMDPQAASAAAAAAGSRAVTTTNLDEFMGVPMDAVFVCTPIHLHEEPSLKAFAAGCHLLVEKPLANTVDSCRRIVGAAQAARKTLAVGFNMRYYPSMAFVRRAIRDGRIGRLDHVRVFGGDEGLSKFRVAWQYRAPESGGGAMMDVGIHATDLGRWLLGEVTSVYGIMSESIWHVPGSEDNAVAVFRSPDGIPATYHATWDEWTGYQVRLEAYGDLGMVRGSYAPMRAMLVTQDKPGGKRRTEHQHYFGIQVREKLRTWHTTVLASFDEELADFLKLVDGRGDVEIADGYAGLRSVEIAEAVRRSTATGQVVTLPDLGRMSPGT